MKQRLLKRDLWLKAGLLGLVCLIALMIGISPQAAGPAGVVVWFGVFYVVVFSLLATMDGYLFKKSETHSVDSLMSYAVWSTGIVSLIALRSLGQLQIRDLLLIGLLIGLLAFYIRKQSR